MARRADRQAAQPACGGGVVSDSQAVFDALGLTSAERKHVLRQHAASPPLTQEQVNCLQALAARRLARERREKRERERGDV